MIRKVLFAIVLMIMPAGLLASEPSAPITSEAFYAGSPAEASFPPESQPMGAGAFFAGTEVEVAEFNAVPSIPEVDPWESAFMNYNVPPTQDGEVVCLDCGETVNILSEDFCTSEACSVAEPVPSQTTTTTTTTTTMTSQEGGDMLASRSSGYANYGGPVRNFFGNGKTRRQERRARRQSRGGLFRLGLVQSRSSGSYQYTSSNSSSVPVSSGMTMMA